MALLSARSLLRIRGGRVVLDHVSFVVEPGESMGLVGANGSGKTSLLRILAGLDPVDDGRLDMPEGLDVAHLAQVPEVSGDPAVWDWAVEGAARLRGMEDELRRMEEAMAGGDADPGRLAAYGELAERFERGGGYGVEHRLRAALMGLGVEEALFGRPLSTLSGGQRARVALARFLMAGDELLLLDEPGNHLDLEGMAWLGEHLAKSPATVLLASHDRDLLERACDRFLVFEGGGLREERSGWIAGFRGARGRDRFFRSDGGGEGSTRLVLAPLDEGPELQIQAFGLRREAGGRELLGGLDLELRRGERLALVGPNGCGKSRLLRVLAGADEPDGGRLHYGEGVNLGHLDQEPRLENLSASALDGCRAVAAGFGDGRLRNHLAFFGLSGEHALRPLASLSGGQRRRAELARLVLGGHNLLLLDEVSNHLDLPARMALEEALASFEGSVVFVTHDAAFLQGVATRVLRFDGRGGITMLEDPAAFGLRGGGGEREREREREKKEKKGKEKKEKRARRPSTTAFEEAIERLEQELAEADRAMAEAASRDGGRIDEAALAARSALEAELARLWAEWEALVEEGD